MRHPGGTESIRQVLLYKGAEADVIKGTWCGLPAVYKIRKKLPYRLPILDEEIRMQRTLHEADMIRSAKRAGVAAPHLYFVDPPGATLVMEFIEGPRLKDLTGSVSEHQLAELFFKFGVDVARLHSSGIMHGDLTTANVVKRDNDLVFLDFGLSVHTNRTEDQAVDLRLMKETIMGAHSEISQVALSSLQEGYRSVAGETRTKGVFRQLRSIERRGRYARVE